MKNDIDNIYTIQAQSVVKLLCAGFSRRFIEMQCNMINHQAVIKKL